MAISKISPGFHTSEQKVKVLRAFPADTPSLYFEVYVVGDDVEQRQFAKMLAQARCTKAGSIQAADLVVFTGGVDINPALYGEKPHPTTYYSDERDAADIAAYNICLEEGIPMFGVCRGAQLGWALAGGKLLQDVDNHQGDHTMWDTRKQNFISKVSSVHHQAAYQPSLPSAQILGDTRKSQTVYLNDKDHIKNWQKMDVEAYFHKDTGFLGVQGHPEYGGYDEFRLWTTHLIEEFFLDNPDYKYKDIPGGTKALRLIDARLDERKKAALDSKTKKELN